jgi:prepilin-type N-terminal cleavage/methylation domain-containing protein/prepilin-type processing-associated H-X9-DG protein
LLFRATQEETFRKATAIGSTFGIGNALENGDDMVRARNRYGFTLVELLIVIGIIALLIGILLPALNRARSAANEAVCMSNLHQWGIGLQMYADQNKGSLPLKGPDGSTGAGTSNFFGPPQATTTVIGFDDPAVWFNAIPPMVGGKSWYQLLVLDAAHTLAAPKDGVHSVFVCPSAGPAASLNSADVISNGWFVLNGIDSTGALKNSTGMFGTTQFKFYSSYVWNSQLASSTATGDQTTLKMSSLQYASETVVMVEKVANSSEYQDPIVQRWSNANPSVYGSGNGNKITSQGLTTNIAQPKADWTRFAARHRGGGMLMFADGHVSWFAWPDVQYPANQLPLTQTSDVNHYGKIRWSALGPVNTGA